jgi:hypothetical protein
MLEILLPRMIGLFILGFMAGFIWIWCTFIKPEDPGIVTYEDDKEYRKYGLRRVKE